jgi:D-3-phosphoglycerate dehydrogenase
VTTRAPEPCPAAPPRLAGTVLITDYAWPDLDIERAVLGGAGCGLVAGPAEAAAADVIEALVRQHQPVGILSNWARLSAAAIASSPALRIVARLGVGLDNIDVAAATRQGVWVTNVPDFCVEEVSEHAVGLLLAWSRGIVRFDRETHAGLWRPASARLRRVATLTVGLVGYGRIGQRIAAKLAPYGATLLASTARPRADDGRVAMLPLDELMRRSDVVIVSAPLSRDTHHLIDARRLALCPASAFLINVSRGALVDSEALRVALASGRLDGAGLDVIEGEPAVPAWAQTEPRLILTPHIAFSSDASLADLRRRACEEIVRTLAGAPPREARNAPDTGARDRC